MWDKDCLYRHVKNKDVAFEIQHVYDNPSFGGVWMFDVNWWNIGSCHKPYPMGISGTICIKTSDMRSWQKMQFDELGPKPDEAHY